MFHTNQPVTESAFFDRESQLARLDELVSKLRAGSPEWLAVLGSRKIGKSSLVHEARRRTEGHSVRFVVIDVTETAPVSLAFFRVYALRTVDAVFGVSAGVSFERLADKPGEYGAEIVAAEGFSSLGRDARAVILDLTTREMTPARVREHLRLPERIAQDLGISLVVAIDEFQELSSLAARRSELDPFPVIRSIWQRHERVAYVVSGSERSMLEDLAVSKTSPFFQHFGLLELSPFSAADAVELLVMCSPVDRKIGPRLARRAVEAIGSHPFYVQLLGDAMVRMDPPYDEHTLKVAMQDLMFSPTGRLSLFFRNELERLVGRSTYLAAVLDVLADAPLGLSDLAKAIGATTGQTRNYVGRLGSAVTHEGGAYALSDSTFGKWLRWRRPGGTVVPMMLVGDQAEQDVAVELARSGFDLVYRSRGSRGAFDILATHGASQLGVQVKKTELPVVFAKRDFNRMVAEADRFGWSWVVAAVDAEARVTFLDPARADIGKQVRFHSAAAIDNLLAWLHLGGR